MADNPAHYHAITRMTERWQAFVRAVDDVASNTAAERARADKEEHEKEVHVTGEAGTSKERATHATTSD